ncbi:hypothetical protein R6Q59_031109 [Mikania micrantha]
MEELLTPANPSPAVCAAEYRYLAPPASSSSREYTTSGQLSLTGLPLVTPMARLRRVFQRPAVTSFSPSPLGAHSSGRHSSGDLVVNRLVIFDNSSTTSRSSHTTLGVRLQIQCARIYKRVTVIRMSTRTRTDSKGTLTEAELKKHDELLNFKGQPVYAAMEFFRVTEYSIQKMLERYKLPRWNDFILDILNAERRPITESELKKFVGLPVSKAVAYFKASESTILAHAKRCKIKLGSKDSTSDSLSVVDPVHKDVHMKACKQGFKRRDTVRLQVEKNDLKILRVEKER